MRRDCGSASEAEVSRRQSLAAHACSEVAMMMEPASGSCWAMYIHGKSRSATPGKKGVTTTVIILQNYSDPYVDVKSTTH